MRGGYVAFEKYVQHTSRRAAVSAARTVAAAAIRQAGIRAALWAVKPATGEEIYK